jgi:hypothetical protein
MILALLSTILITAREVQHLGVGAGQSTHMPSSRPSLSIIVRSSSVSCLLYVFVSSQNLASQGLRMQQRGPNCEMISEVQFSCDIVSDESFSITLTPPDPAAIELLRAEHGVVDEKAASLSSYHRENPTTWIFNLQDTRHRHRISHRTRIQLEHEVVHTNVLRGC